MRLTAILALCSLLVSFSINLFVAESQSEFFENSSLNNKILGNGSWDIISVWLHCLLAVIGTVATFYTVFDLREEARELYKET